MEKIKIEYDEDGLPVDDYDPDPVKSAVRKKMQEEEEALKKIGYTEEEIQDMRDARFRIENPSLAGLFDRLENK